LPVCRAAAPPVSRQPPAGPLKRPESIHCGKASDQGSNREESGPCQQHRLFQPLPARTLDWLRWSQALNRLSRGRYSHRWAACRDSFKLTAQQNEARAPKDGGYEHRTKRLCVLFGPGSRARIQLQGLSDGGWGRGRAPGCAREGKLFEGSTYERQVVIRVSEVPNTLCTASTSDRDSGRGGV
jgi:hypothetical protein